MNKLRNILLKFLFPPFIILVPAALISAALLIYVFVNSKENSVIAYVSYVLSAYALTAACCKTPSLIKKIKSGLHSNKHSHKYLSDSELRARISLQSGLLINIVYSVFKIAAGIYYGSFWFGAEGTYYTILSIMRYSLIRKERALTKNTANEWKTYRNCGFLMLLLNLIMSVIIVQVVFQNKSYNYSGLIIYASAAYTFYRLTFSIIHVIKFNPRKYSVLSASKLINLSAALMSLFALQSAMLTQFGSEAEINFQALNAATGSAVCGITVSTAMFMIFNSKKKIKTINKTQT